jgi:hypothetical protein
VAGLPLFTIEKIGDASPQPLPAGNRPLAGVKVLDLTRVNAGPVSRPHARPPTAPTCLNTITAAHLPAMEALVIDTNRGKLTAQIDLRDAAGRGKLAACCRGCGHFHSRLPARRPSPIRLQALRKPGAQEARIVCVSLCGLCHEGHGPGRRGFDTLVQNRRRLNAPRRSVPADRTPPEPIAVGRPGARTRHRAI